MQAPVAWSPFQVQLWNSLATHWHPADPAAQEPVVRRKRPLPQPKEQLARPQVKKRPQPPAYPPPVALQAHAAGSQDERWTSQQHPSDGAGPAGGAAPRLQHEEADAQPYEEDAAQPYEEDAAVVDLTTSDEGLDTWGRWEEDPGMWSKRQHYWMKWGVKKPRGGKFKEFYCQKYHQ